MFSIDCMIMGTCDPKRLRWLEQSLEFMDAQHFPFKTKHLVIDQLDDRKFPKDLYDKLLNRGWKIHTFSFKSRAICMARVCEQISSQVVFYNEDDVLVKLPSFDHVQRVFGKDLDGRHCGMLSMTLGGSNHDFPNQKFGDLKDIKKNVFFEFKEYLVFQRDEAKRSLWFVEFPGLFINTELLKEIVKDDFGNGGLEIHMTNRYFDLQKDRQFYKASLCKKNVYDVIKWYETNFSYEMLETAKWIRILDENQGNAKFDLEKLPEL